MSTLGKTDQNLLGILNSAKEPYLLLNKKGEVVEFNDSFTQLYSFSKQELLNRDVKQIFPNLDYKDPDISTTLKINGLLYFLIKLNNYLHNDFSIQILSVISEICFQLDEDFNIVFANKRAFESWNMYPDDIVGKNIFTVLNGIYHPLLPLLKKTSNSGTVFFKELYLEKIDRWIFSNVRHYERGFIILTTDITEKVKYKERLKEKELQLKTLVDNIPDLVTRWNKQGKLIFANTSFNKKDIGLAKKPDIKTHMKGIEMPALDWGTKIQYVYETGQVVQHHTTLQQENELAFLDSIIVPEKDETGNISSVLAISRDVTDSKLAQQKTIESNHLLQSLTDGTSIALLYLKPVLNKTGNITDLQILNINQKAKEIFFSHSTIEKENPNFITSNNAAINECIIKNLNKYYREGSPARFEFSIPKNTQDEYYDVSLSRLNDNIIFSALDITFKVMSQKKIRKLEEKQHHELLNAIMQTQEEERQRIAESLHNEFGQLLNVCLLELNNSHPSVRALLKEAIVKVRSISHELMPPILKNFGLEAAFRELFDSRELIKNDIKTDLKIRGLNNRLNHQLEIALYRIVQEILNNVIKHSKASKVNFVFQIDAKTVKIKLEDNGIGFNPNHNLGFGLKYINSRIKLLNGISEIISTPQKKGTLFLITIPLN